MNETEPLFLQSLHSAGKGGREDKEPHALQGVTEGCEEKLGRSWGSYFI